MGIFEPHLTERVLRKRVFKRALSFRTFPLKNSDQRFSLQHVDSLGDYQKQLMVTPYVLLFSVEEEIEFAHFLTQYKQACEDIAICEGIAPQLFSFNLKGVALASFSTYHNSHVAAVSKVKITLNRAPMLFSGS